MTTKQHTTLNMSLLPLAIILILILGVGYFLLQGEIEFPKFNKGPQIGRLENFPTVIDTTKTLDKNRKVIRSETELDEFLNSIDENNQLTVKEKINWDKQIVIAITSTTNEESGHRIKVAKAYENKSENTLLIKVVETEMGSNCDVEKEKNIAVDLVTLTKTDYIIDFERELRVEECDEPSSDEDAVSTSESETKN